MGSKAETVFVIDPDEAVCEGIRVLLGTLDIPVLCYSDAEEFLDRTADQRKNGGCLLVEANLPGLDSLALLQRLRKEGTQLPVVVLASTRNRDIADRAIQAGAVDVIDKPLVNGSLLERLRRQLTHGPGLLAGAPCFLTLQNGVVVTIRAIRPHDVEIEQAFVTGLSWRSRYFRFFAAVKSLSPTMLEKFTRPRYPHEWALIATISEAGKEKEIGVARYAPTEDRAFAEFAIVVADEWQGNEIGRRLLQKLIAIAEKAGIKQLEGLVLPGNVEMLRLAKKLGFDAQLDPDDATTVRVVRSLADLEPHSRSTASTTSDKQP